MIIPALLLILNAGLLACFGLLAKNRRRLQWIEQVLNVDELDDELGSPPGEDYRSVLVSMPAWMLDELRARAGRRDVSVAELIRRDVSVCRLRESQGLDPWVVERAAASRADQSADEGPEQP